MKTISIEKFEYFTEGKMSFIVKGIRTYQVMIFIIIALSISSTCSWADDSTQTTYMDDDIKRFMEEGKIPGLALIVVEPNRSWARSYGYSDMTNNQEVTQLTTFELASCSKAFTGLAIAQLEEQGLIQLNDNISDYLPWFYVLYHGKPVKITIGQALYHTSGIPTNTLSKLKPSTSENALEQAVRSLIGTKIQEKPGEVFQYATMNYDILGLIIEKVSNRTYENYIRAHILRPLSMDYSRVGIQEKDSLRSKGYKISFNRPWLYPSPNFRGNNPAGYVVSNSEDMVSWLKVQLGMHNHPYKHLIRKTHEIKEVSAEFGYGMGWFQEYSNKDILFHSGRNPNFTSYIILNTKTKQGVAILANSNSQYTRYIGQYVMKELGGYGDIILEKPDSTLDLIYSLITLLLVCVILVQLVILGVYMQQMKSNKRTQRIYEHKDLRMWYVMIIVTYIVYIVLIHVILRVVLGTNWRTLALWSPDSCTMSIIILGIVFGMCHIIYGYSFIYPRLHHASLQDSVPYENTEDKSA